MTFKLLLRTSNFGYYIFKQPKKYPAFIKYFSLKNGFSCLFTQIHIYTYNLFKSVNL